MLLWLARSGCLVPPAYSDWASRSSGARSSKQASDNAICVGPRSEVVGKPRSRFSVYPQYRPAKSLPRVNCRLFDESATGRAGCLFTRSWEAKSTELEGPLIPPRIPDLAGSDGIITMIDTPGVKISGSANFRYLEEFIVGVSGWNDPNSLVSEFGGLHFVVAVDITPKNLDVSAEIFDSRPTQGAMGKAGCLFPYSVVSPRAPQ